MDLSGITPPRMDWDSSNLPWKKFHRHVELIFQGPLKSKEEEKVAYLLIWVDNKGRDICQSWSLEGDMAKILKTHTMTDLKVRCNQNSILCLLVFDSIMKCKEMIR